MIVQVISVAEMARLIGLSRQRFHQLVKEGVFPPPVYDIATRRPHYTEEIQAVCLAVREKNVGINGQGRFVLRPSSWDRTKKTNQSPTVHSTQDDETQRADRRPQRAGTATSTEQDVAAALERIVSDWHRRGGGSGGVADRFRPPDATGLGGKTRGENTELPPS